MTRWLWLLLVGVVVFATAGACDTPAPPSWTAPVLDSVSFEPAVVQAGAPFTVSIAAHDDREVRHVQVSGVTRPDGVELAEAVCEDGPTFGPGWQPAPSVTVTIECELPVPTPNGTWTANVALHDGECTRCGVSTEVSFEVTGGFDTPA